MLFNSAPFLLYFLPIVLGGFLVLAWRGARYWAGLWITGASLVFYGSWNLTYVPLLVGSLLFNYFVGTYLARHRQWPVLAAGIALNIAVLVYYKYTGFLIEVARDLTGADLAIPVIVLPLALSFFTFQQIAYLVDAYDGVAEEHDLGNYALFITFFPHLIAGPITHHREMLPQFTPRQAADQDAFSAALRDASPDFQSEHGYSAGKYQDDVLKLASKYVGHTFGCLSLTLEMPFKDNANAPDCRVGWNGARSARLGADLLGPLLLHLRGAP